MENKIEKGKYLNYISGLKGMACLFIMCFHYLEIYKASPDFLPRIKLFDIILDSAIGFLFNQGYWLYLFFVISGYLISKSKISSIKDFFIKTILRFFRFCIPVFFADCIIFVVVKFTGFSNYDTTSLFTNSFLQTYPYGAEFTFVELLKSPVTVFFNGNKSFNPPYWVIGPMFSASVCIYFFKFLNAKFSEKYENVFFAILTAALIIFSKIEPVITAVLLGMCLEIFNSNMEKNINKPFFNICLLALIMIIYIVKNEIISCFFFMALIILIPKTPALNTIFSSKPFLYLGNLSWGIYSFHMTIFCTIGCKLLLIFVQNMNLFFAYALSSLISVLLTILLSQIYYLSFEKVSTVINKTIRNLLNKSFKVN